jgi:RNA methyltransferase, TrmH family
MSVITSTGNAAVKAARRLAHRSHRGRTDEFLVEGPQVVREALPYLRRLFVTERARRREAVLVAAAETHGVTVLDVTEPVLAALAETVTPQGMVGVAALEGPDLAGVTAGATLLVVLWEAADPGNVGTVIRSADAAGADGVVLTAGSADPHNPKAVRASAGSLFHLPVAAGTPGHATLVACRDAGLQLVAAAADGDRDVDGVDLIRPTALVFGSEAAGLPMAVRRTCDVTARVPIHTSPRPGYTGHAESLNVAATVAMFVYEAARQRRGRATQGGRPEARSAGGGR